MSIPIWDGAARKEIEDNTLWTRQFRNQLVAPPPENDNDGRNPGFPQPVRGILLQSIWGGQSGKMQCVEYLPQRYSFMLSVNGKNIANPNIADPANVNFKIKVYGVQADDTLAELFTTVPVSVESIPDRIASALLIGAQGASLPVKRTDIQVTLGNPSPGGPFIPFPSQTEIDKTTNPPDVYIGAWMVTFSGQLIKQFKGLTAEIVSVDSYILTDVIAYPSFDTLTDRIISVKDIYDRPSSYPWKVGSKAVCLYFPDIGFGIIGSNFHDMSDISDDA